MKLSKNDLREMADTLDAIETAKINVRQVIVGVYKVLLERTEHQIDGVEYCVIGITDGEFSGKGEKVMRDDAQPTYPGLPTGRRSGGFR